MENILKYQELDNKLQQLEKKMATSSEKSVMNQMIGYVKDAQNKSAELEQKARKMMDEYINLKKEYDKNILLIKLSALSTANGSPGRSFLYNSNKPS